MELLRRISPDEVRSLWPLVAPGLRQAAMKGAQRWTCETVLDALLKDEATLLCGYKGEEYVGFVVLTIETEPRTGERNLFCWAAYAKERGLLEAAMRDCEEAGRSLGLRRFRHRSGRRGWERRNLGFRVLDITYEKEIA